MFLKERVTRTGKIFQVGSYPDKQFDLKEPEADAAIASMSEPIPANIEHRPSPLDGALGELKRVWREGVELFAECSIPKWLDEHLKEKGVPLQPSLEWDRSTKQIKGVAWVNFPRIEDAALMSAFSVAFSSPEITDPALFWDDSVTWFDKDDKKSTGDDLKWQRDLGSTNGSETHEAEASHGKYTVSKKDATSAYDIGYTPHTGPKGKNYKPAKGSALKLEEAKQRCQQHHMEVTGKAEMSQIPGLKDVPTINNGDRAFFEFILNQPAVKSRQKGTPTVSKFLDKAKALFHLAGVEEKQIDKLTDDDLKESIEELAEEEEQPDFSKSAEFTALKTENEELKKKVAEFDDEMKQQKALAQYNADCTEIDKLARTPNNRILPAEADDYKSMAKENPAAFAATLPILQKRAPLAQFSTEPRVFSRVGGAADGDNPGNQLTEKTKTRMKENPNETYDIAFSRVCEENRDLAAAYNAQFSTVGGN